MHYLMWFSFLVSTESPQNSTGFGSKTRRSESSYWFIGNVFRPDPGKRVPENWVEGCRKISEGEEERRGKRVLEVLTSLQEQEEEGNWMRSEVKAGKATN